MTTKSHISAPHAIAQALNELKPLIGGDFKFLNATEYTPLHEALSKSGKTSFVSGKASIGTAGPVNDFLKGQGFSITFNDPPPDGIVTAGVVNILVMWREELSKVSLLWKRNDHKKVPAVFAKQIEVFDTPLLSQPVFSIPVKEDFKVFFAKADPNAQVRDNFLDLQVHLQKLQPTLEYSRDQYDGLVVPMINLDVSGDLQVFDGIQMQGADKKGYFTASGKFQGILKLNEKGARAKAAAGGMLLRSCVVMKLPTYEMNEPFWFWITQGETVYFAAHIFQDCLAEPANLD
jgi:hypothetical protein